MLRGLNVTGIRTRVLGALLITTTFLGSSPVFADSLNQALAKAYQNNSTLNYDRAGVRVTDEGVAIAKSGYRPTVNLNGTVQHSNTDRARTNSANGGLQVQQKLFDGFQTRNQVRAAEAAVRAANANLGNSEQEVLLNGVAAYLDVIRDRQIAVLRERNLSFLNEQLRAAQSRFDVGEGTRTDIAQAQAQRQLAISQLAAARASVGASEAIYYQIVGAQPTNLTAPGPISKLLPKGIDQAVTLALTTHPAVKALEHSVDVAGYNVKAAEGALLPQVSASATAQRSWQESDYAPGLPGVSSNQDGTNDSATIGATVTIPLYSGGRLDATVRQTKESLNQARINVDVTRDEVRRAVTAAWVAYNANNQAVAASREGVRAARLALEGVVEERNVGQRTTLDVLQSQADVIDAEIAVVQTQRDLVYSSYQIVAAIGALNVRSLGLQVAEYKPEEHYNAVKDKWRGLRTPDGR
ncbi:TolC family outer membrane protein [Limoniibacter endophyticus]|uniref:Transporter n=1 Tax=Limoniibacter endophyticus TaxID=1565040 RepID=A0A8J3GEX0_9HYPH|nr:TolC family outer membrane protein [Limoniibacter endophyticus]GHC63050.1 transporter [Limoniibacter endophyticus]